MYSRLLFVTIAILFVWHFFRIGIFLSATGYRCFPMYKFWFGSFEGSWPLFGMFALLFFLIFAWNAAMLFDPEIQQRSDRAILGFNAVTLLAVGFALAGLTRLSELEEFEEAGSYAAWNRTVNYWDRGDRCEQAKPFLGRWEIVSVSSQAHERNFPFAWVELKEDLSLHGARGSFAPRITGTWAVEEAWLWTVLDVKRRPARDAEAVWIHDLGEDQLTLTHYEGKARVVLQRAP